jgi:hypothetical protein
MCNKCRSVTLSGDVSQKASGNTSTGTLTRRKRNDRNVKGVGVDRKTATLCSYMAHSEFTLYCASVCFCSHPNVLNVCAEVLRRLTDIVFFVIVVFVEMFKVQWYPLITTSVYPDSSPKASYVQWYQFIPYYYPLNLYSSLITTPVYDDTKYSVPFVML